MRQLLFCSSIALLLSSCAGHISISSDKCETKALWKKTPHKRSDFHYNYTSWAFLGGILSKEVKLEKILMEQNISCNQLETISITAQNRLSDKILGITPLLTTKTYTVSGTYKNRSNIRKDKLSRKDAN